MNKINIGVTVLIQDPIKNQIFNNGIRQNVVLIRELFSYCNNVNNSYIINTAEVTDYRGTCWEQYSKDIITMKQAEELCDLIVICHGSLSDENCLRYVKKQKKLVKLIFGAELTGFNERILFKPEPGGIYGKSSILSAVWISPHFYDRDKHFHQVINNCPTHLASYIWDPRFIEQHNNELINRHPEITSSYTIKDSQKRVISMEPNLNIVKTSTIPIVTMELFYREYPQLLSSFSVFGGLDVAKKKDMIDFALNLDINKAKKLFFEARYPVAWTMHKNGDILLSHQNQCELNYLLLDVAWMGYPVVHNSPMMKELGWYYPENNSEIAIEHLKYICENFDSVEHPDNKYLNKSREFASKYLPTNKDNIKCYEDLIDKVFEKQVTTVTKKIMRNDVIYNIDTSTNTFNWWDKDFQNDWEVDVHKCFDRFANKNKIALDIGAWNGVHSIYLANRFKKVYSFEPDPLAYADLQKNTKSLNNIEIINCAISDKIEQTKISPLQPSWLGWSGSSLLDKMQGEGSVDCSTITLDHFLQGKQIKIEDIGLVKIDIEGYEKVVIPAINEFLKKFRGVLVISMHRQKHLLTNEECDGLQILLSETLDGPYDMLGQKLETKTRIDALLFKARK